MARKKQKKVLLVACDDSIEFRYNSNTRIITSPFLKSEDKIPEPLGFVEPEEEIIADYEKGEKTKFRKIEALQNIFRKLKIGYEYAQSEEVFWIVKNKIGRTFNIAVYIDAGYFMCTCENYETVYSDTKSIREFSDYLKSQKSIHRYGATN